jgi:hypothetical protein
MTARSWPKHRWKTGMNGKRQPGARPARRIAAPRKPGLGRPGRHKRAAPPAQPDNAPRSRSRNGWQEPLQRALETWCPRSQPSHDRRSKSLAGPGRCIGRQEPLRRGLETRCPRPQPSYDPRPNSLAGPGRCTGWQESPWRALETWRPSPQPLHDPHPKSPAGDERCLVQRTRRRRKRRGAIPLRRLGGYYPTSAYSRWPTRWMSGPQIPGCSTGPEMRRAGPVCRKNWTSHEDRGATLPGCRGCRGRHRGRSCRHGCSHRHGRSYRRSRSRHRDRNRPRNRSRRHNGDDRSRHNPRRQT